MATCFKQLGYSTSVVYDDGVQAVPYPEGTLVLDGGTAQLRQVRPPSTQVSAWLPDGGLVTVTVQDGGGASRTTFSHGVRPRSTGQLAAIADCANA